MRRAARQYGIPVEEWLDLSTGINPHSWPVPAVPSAVWARLPEEEDGLEEAAARYYGAPRPLPLAGSQAAIQSLPKLRPPCCVGVPRIGYREHAQAWRSAGHRLVELADNDPGHRLEEGSDRLDCLVVISPNNPTGHRWPVERLLDWHARLAARGGWLVVDEAFIDATPDWSLAPYAGRPGLVVLRSFGKFFGLAGVRVGFLLAEPSLQARMRTRLGPWTLTGPSRLVARQALADVVWQASARADLWRAADRLADLLRRHGLRPAGGTSLFQWVLTPEADRIHAALARRAILVRRFDRPASLRFGLPGEASAWRRLALALDSVVGPGEGAGPSMMDESSWSAA